MSDRKRALETAIAQIERQYGKGAVMRLGENTGMNVEAVSTGSFTLDLATGIGGLPRGRITEIYGPEASGKTTLALHAIAEAQKAGGEAAFIDAEHALDPVYAANLGVDVESLLVSQPDNGEQALEIAEALVRSGAVDILVVDSVAALVPRAEIEGEMGDSHVGLHARLMSQALRKLAGAVAKSNCIIIFINQLREKVGIVYGNPEVTTGGRALKFYASMRIDVRRAEQLKAAGNEIIGSRTRAKIVKNKVAPPFKEAEFDIIYGKGISKEGELLDAAVSLDIIHKSGAWFSYGDTRLGQGRENVRDYLSSNTEFRESLEKEVKAHISELSVQMKPSYRIGSLQKGSSQSSMQSASQSNAQAASQAAAQGASQGGSRSTPQGTAQAASQGSSQLSSQASSESSAKAASGQSAAATASPKEAAAKASPRSSRRSARASLDITVDD